MRWSPQAFGYLELERPCIQATAALQNMTLSASVLGSSPLKRRLAPFDSATAFLLIFQEISPLARSGGLSNCTQCQLKHISLDKCQGRVGTYEGPEGWPESLSIR
jgi:hypothetical protein